MTIRRRHLAAAAVAATGLAATVMAVTAAGPAQAQPAAAKPPGWRIVGLIGDSDLYLPALVAVSPSEAWVGGSQSEPGGTGPVLDEIANGELHNAAPPGGNGVFVNDLSAAGPDDVWATEANAPTVLHLGEHGLSAHSLAIGGDDILTNGVAAVSTKSTWVFTYDFSTKTSYSIHYNGKSWTQRALPYTIDGDSDALVSGTSDSNIWALSFSGPGGAADALHYNGRRWRRTYFPSHLAPAGYSVYPEGIYAQSPSNVWAALYSNGSTVKKLRYGPVLLLHWNGRRWSKITGTLPTAALTGAMTSDGHGGLWLYGLTTQTSGVFLHYSGRRFRAYKVPTARASHQVITVTALSEVPGTHTVMATGSVNVDFVADSGAAVLEYTP
jgi:hypothetical protein